MQSDKIPNPINIFEEVKKLNFPSDDFIVVGSAIMAVKGIRDAHDLDIVVSQELFDICKNKNDVWELKPWTRTGRIGKYWLKSGETDLMTEIQSGQEDFELEVLKKEGELINGIWFLSLQQLITFKKNYGRPRDFEDIALMEKYLEEN